MKKTMSILMVGLTTLMVSCKKDEATIVSNPTTKELLTANVWKLTNFSSPDTAVVSQTLLNQWKDTLLVAPLSVTYKTDGTYAYSDSSDYGKWELSGDKTIVYKKGTLDESTSSIDKLTSTEFVSTYDWKISPSKTIKITEYAVKK